MIRRHIEASIRAALGDTPVVLLNGARQTGKTTLVQATARDRKATYVTLDDISVLASARRDPTGFIRQLGATAVIDEVQNAPELFPAIKLEVDRDRRPGRFLLTGSANVLSLPRLSESLAGRMEVIPLHAFSQGEIESRQDDFIARLFATSPRWSAGTGSGPRDLPERILRGGFPEVVGRRDPARRDAWFGSYVSTILQRDVRDLARIDGLTSLPNLLHVLAARTAGLLNMADLARDAALPHSTVMRHLALLEMLFLAYRLPAWSANIGKRLTKAPKIHMCDTGIAGHLLGQDLARLKQEPLLAGHLAESFVVAELRKQASWTRTPVLLHHFRTATGTEIDVVLESRQGLLAGVEVKSAATVGSSDFAGLNHLAGVTGNRFHAGVVLYQGDKVLPFGKRFWALPFDTLWRS